MQPLPYRIPESIKQLMEELDKLNVKYEMIVARHNKGRCSQYKNTFQHYDICPIDHDFEMSTFATAHGAYALKYTASSSGVEKIIKELPGKTRVMVEEPGRTDLSVRTVIRKRKCCKCREPIPRGDKYLRKVYPKLEENICRKCAERELETILSELRAPSNLPEKGSKCTVQKW